MRPEPARLQHHRCELAAVAGAADHGDGFRRVERGAPSRHEGVQRDVDRAVDASRVPFVLLAAVDELDVGESVVDTFDVGEILVYVEPGYQRPTISRSRALRRTSDRPPGRAGRTGPPPPPSRHPAP